jgi:hypothetical protein
LVYDTAKIAVATKFAADRTYYEKIAYPGQLLRWENLDKPAVYVRNRQTFIQRTQDVMNSMMAIIQKIKDKDSVQMPLNLVSPGALAEGNPGVVEVQIHPLKLAAGLANLPPLTELPAAIEPLTQTSQNLLPKAVQDLLAKQVEQANKDLEPEKSVQVLAPPPSLPAAKATRGRGRRASRRTTLG